jgi:hypothetical protein
MAKNKNRGKIIKTKSKPKSKTIGRTSVPQPSVETALESSLIHPLQQESHNAPAEEKIKEDHPIDDELMPPRGAFPPARRHIDWAEEDIDNLTYEEVRDDINRLPSIPQAAKSLDWPYLIQVKASRIVKSAKPFCMNCRFGDFSYDKDAAKMIQKYYPLLSCSKCQNYFHAYENCGIVERWDETSVPATPDVWLCRECLPASAPIPNQLREETPGNAMENTGNPVIPAFKSGNDEEALSASLIEGIESAADYEDNALSESDTVRNDSPASQDKTPPPPELIHDLVENEVDITSTKCQIDEQVNPHTQMFQLALLDSNGQPLEVFELYDNDKADEFTWEHDMEESSDAAQKFGEQPVVVDLIKVDTSVMDPLADIADNVTESRSVSKAESDKVVRNIQEVVPMPLSSAATQELQREKPEEHDAADEVSAETPLPVGIQTIPSTLEEEITTPTCSEKSSNTSRTSIDQTDSFGSDLTTPSKNANTLGLDSPIEFSPEQEQSVGVSGES